MSDGRSSPALEISIEGTASILILVSGLAHAVVNAILKSGRDKMSGRALIDGFSALLVAPAGQPSRLMP